MTEIMPIASVNRIAFVNLHSACQFLLTRQPIADWRLSAINLWRRVLPPPKRIVLGNLQARKLVNLDNLLKPKSPNLQGDSPLYCNRIAEICMYNERIYVPFRNRLAVKNKLACGM